LRININYHKSYNHIAHLFRPKIKKIEKNDFFIILANPRTGTGYLSNLLKSHTELKVRTKEIFGPTNIQKIKKNRFDPYKILRSSFQKTERLSGFKIFYKHATFSYFSHYQNRYKKLRISEIAKLNTIWKILKDRKDLKIIHLKRKNILKTLISLELAKKMDKFHIKQDPPRFNKNLRFRLDHAYCLRYFKETERLQRHYKKFFKDHPMLEVYYEDLLENRDPVLLKIQNFIGVKPEQLTTRLKKQNRYPISRLIINYYELKDKFKGTQYICSFSSELSF
jgi:hypothetical protein